eukprot:5283902-Pleurochrysis_carterae.AAC.1
MGDAISSSSAPILQVGAGRCKAMIALEIKKTKANADEEEWVSARLRKSCLRLLPLAFAGQPSHRRASAFSSRVLPLNIYYPRERERATSNMLVFAYAHIRISTRACSQPRAHGPSPLRVQQHLPV